MEIANVIVRASVICGCEDQLELFGGLEAECGEEMQVLCVKVGAGLLEEAELVVGYSDVLKL